LLPGTYVTLRARLGQMQGVYSIPQAAVQRDARSAYVMVVGADGNVVRRDITLDRADGGNWIATGGLQDGEQVIVSGLQKVAEGAPAKAVPWTPAGPAGQAPAPGNQAPASAAPAGDGQAPAADEAPSSQPPAADAPAATDSAEG